MSPEAMLGGDARTNLRPVVVAFYRALFARDAELIGRIVDEHFAPDAVLHRPESLPGGGRTEGAERIKRFMGATATMEGGPVDVAAMTLVNVLEGDDDVVAVELEFAFAGVPTSAIELWTVRDLKVTSIKAYYWDTKAMTG